MKNSKLYTTLRAVVLFLFLGCDPLSAQNTQDQGYATDISREAPPYVMKNYLNAAGDELTVDAFVTGKKETVTVTQVDPIDFCLLLDYKINYFDNMKAAVNNFITNVKTNADQNKVDGVPVKHRLSIVKCSDTHYRYSKNGVQYPPSGDPSLNDTPQGLSYIGECNAYGGNTYVDGGQTVYQDNPVQVVRNFYNVSTYADDLKTGNDAIKPSGGTAPLHALNKAKYLFANTNPSNANGQANSKKVIVLYVDNYPTGAGDYTSMTADQYANECVTVAKALKDAGIIIYVILYGTDTKYVKWAQAISSTYPNAYIKNNAIQLGDPVEHVYYHTSKSTDTYGFFSTIASEVFTSTTTTTTTTTVGINMNGDTYIQEIWSDDYQLRGSVSDIKAYKVPVTSINGNQYVFDTANLSNYPFNANFNLTTVSEHQAVKVSGFDYSSNPETNTNWVGMNENVRQGYELVVKIPVEPKANHFGKLNVNTNASTIYPNNGTATIGQNFAVVSSAPNDWLSYVLAKTGSESGISISGTTATISSNEGLAWFAAHANGYKGTSYANYNVELTADIDMAGKTWVPIGGSGGYSGTFNGNGHVISNLENETSRSTYVGLFGEVAGGTVKNVAVKDCNFTSANTGYSGIIADEVTSGTVSGCVVSGTLTGNGNLGGVVGKVSGGTVHSCVSMVAPTNGGTLVHTGDVANSFAPIDNSRPLVTSGTARNCIYKNTTWNYVKSDGSETTITNEGFDYGKKGCVYSGSTERLVDVLNKYAKDNSYSSWAQPLTASINEGVPVLKMEGFNSVAQASGGTLSYGNLDGLLGNGNNKVLFYGKGERSTAYDGENLYIDEDAALMVTANVKAHTSRFIKNLPSRETEIWHHYASPVNGAATGITYNQTDQMQPGVSCEPQLSTTSLFPSGIESLTQWDLYSYYEPAYHWLNFKRNALSHYKNGDAPQELIVLPTEELQNQANLRNGEGYLIALAESSYIQSNGNLNHGDITRAVTVSDLSATVGAGLEGLNLLGNPYQSYLSFRVFANVNNALWNNDGNAATYLVYDPETDKYSQGSLETTSSGSAAASGIINMHQGFFIVAKASGTATFTDDMRSLEPDNANVHFRDGEKMAYPLINLVARDAEGLGDVAVVEFDRPEFAAAPKIFNYGGMGKVFFHYGDEDDALLFLDEETDQLPVRFAALEDGDYTIEWSTANADFSYLHLLDNMTGNDIDMLARDSYSFAAKTTDYESRFMLVFSYTGIGEENGNEPAKTFAFVHDGNLVVNGQGHMQVIDLNGRTIVTRQLTGEQNTVGLPDVAPGVYVIRLADSKESKVQKIIIK